MPELTMGQIRLHDMSLFSYPIGSRPKRLGCRWSPVHDLYLMQLITNDPALEWRSSFSTLKTMEKRKLPCAYLRDTVISRCCMTLLPLRVGPEVVAHRPCAGHHVRTEFD